MDANPIPPPSPAEDLAKEKPIPPQPITQQSQSPSTTAQTTPMPVAAPSNNPKKWIIISLVILVILLSLGAAVFFAYQYILLKKQAAITTFEACVKANGNMIQTMYPAVCVTRDGRRFPQPLTDEEKPNLLPPDETAGWETITNIEYVYTIKHPDTLEAIATGMDPDIKTANEIVISRNQNGVQTDSPIMYIEAAHKKETVYKTLSLEQIAKANFDANQENKNTTIQMTSQLTPTAFAGVPAYTYTMQSKGFSGKWQGFLTITGAHKVIEFEKNEVHYVIVYIQDPTLEKVLSTFKFTDTTSFQQIRGIQLTQCCSCPVMIDESRIGKNGWVVYEKGKDYTAQRPTACSAPNIGVCAPCPPIECDAPPGMACL